MIINGNIIRKIESGLLKDTEIIIPAAVIDELQSQASQKKRSRVCRTRRSKKTTKIIKEFWFNYKV